VRENVPWEPQCAERQLIPSGSFKCDGQDVVANDIWAKPHKGAAGCRVPGQDAFADTCIARPTADIECEESVLVIAHESALSLLMHLKLYYHCRQEGSVPPQPHLGQDHQQKQQVQQTQHDNMSQCGHTQVRFSSKGQKT